MGKLTDLQLRAWVRAGDPVAKADGDGLTFTLSKAGTAAWTLRFRVAGKRRELTLGRYPDIGIAVARQLAASERAKVAQGIDVAREKQRARQKAVRAMTFGELARLYMEKRLPSLAPATQKQRRQHIEKRILPRLGSIPARELETGDVIALIEAIGTTSKAVGELCLTAISEVFKFGLARRVVVINPCAGLPLVAVFGRLTPKRERVALTEAELREMLPALASIGEQNALVIRLLLATGVRIGELARAQWTHVDFERAEWVVPGEHSKTGAGFVVPLVGEVAAWFRRLEALACGSPNVLPARQKRRAERGATHFEQRTINKVLTELCERLAGKVRPITPHDLRSTARSHLGALGVPVIVAERCLNHKIGGLVGVYDKGDYLPERRQALEAWTRRIVAAESGLPWNVVPLVRRV